MRYGFAESEVEDAALIWLEGIGWSIKPGPEIAPGEIFAERNDYVQTVLEQRFRDGGCVQPSHPVGGGDP